MKMFTNLPGNLRALFSLLRFMTLILAVFWLLMLTFNVWIQRRYMDDPKVAFTFGEAYLQAAPNAVGLDSDTAKPGSLSLVDLRGNLRVDLCSGDFALVSAIYRSLIPVLAVGTGFLWMLFGSLRMMCANIERGEVFSDRNLLLVRRVGWIFIANSVAGFAVAFWAAYVMGGYLGHHVALNGIGTGLLFPGGKGAVGFTMPLGTIPFSGPGGLLIGCLVLMISEAFRQGLALKTENDLTV
jgi:hypothetical protein